jgi:hypothetical protein
VAADGEILVADADAFDDYDGGVIGINRRTREQRVVASGGSFISPTGVALGADGEVMVTDYTALVVVDPASGAQTALPWSSACARPWGLAVVR